MMNMSPSDVAKSLKELAESGYYAVLMDTVSSLVMASISQMGAAIDDRAVEFHKGTANGLMKVHNLMIGLKNIDAAYIEQLLADEKAQPGQEEKK